MSNSKKVIKVQVESENNPALPGKNPTRPIQKLDSFVKPEPDFDPKNMIFQAPFRFILKQMRYGKIEVNVHFINSNKVTEECIYGALNFLSMKGSHTLCFVYLKLKNLSSSV